LVLAIGLTDRRANRGTSSPGSENANPVQIRLAEAPSKPATAPTDGDEGEAKRPVAAQQPPDAEPRSDRFVADALFDRESSHPVCESYGTAIQFLSRPTEAARQALHENKLLFVLHVSGNFEDSKFT